MFVWLVVEDAPEDWGGYAVVKVCAQAKTAKEYVKKQKKKGDYEAQYLTVERYKVE